MHEFEGHAEESADEADDIGDDDAEEGYHDEFCEAWAVLNDFCFVCEEDGCEAGHCE